MAIRMQQRRGTAEQWTSANPVLAEGEIGFEIDNNQFKLGDGVNQWADLSYFRNSNDVDEILDDFIPLSEKGEANGVATLDVDGQVPADQLANATVDLSDYATESYADAAEAAAIAAAALDATDKADAAEAAAIAAAESYADAAVANLVSSAPETLDTLNELAAALGDDASFATTVTNSIATKADASHTHNQSELITTVSDKSAGYTILATDKNSVIRSTGSEITITIANVLAIGERIDFIQSGTGQITFAASGVTLQSKENNLKTAAQYSSATVICVASGVYVLVGDLAA